MPLLSFSGCPSRGCFYKQILDQEKNGSFKIFSRGESAQGKKILARFNEHFRKVLEGLD